MKKMPQGLKVVIIVVAVGLGLMIIVGVAGAVTLIRTIDRTEAAVKNARADGEVFGITGTEKECVVEAVRRSAECDGLRFLCIPQIDAFLYDCIDEATDDPAFCDGIPSSGDDRGVENWTRNVCAQQDQQDDIACTMGLTAANVRCYERRNP
jgi:hypothetical protein